MIKYPDGKTYLKQIKENIKSKNISAANRGMEFESEINLSNSFYIENDIALITKRTTPINVVKVDYSKGARIIDAYFEKQSTTDYNGVYKGRYLDFEAKSTKNTTSFPLSNIYVHQIEHLRKVIKHNGIAFFLIDFELLEEVYFLKAEYVINFIENNKRKSIPYEDIKSIGKRINRSLSPRLDYIKAINECYFE